MGIQEEPTKQRVVAGVGIGTILTIVGLSFPANKAYVDWHNERYPLRSEVITIADAQTIKETGEQALQTANSASQKLDMVNIQLAAIRVQGAVTAASALQSELDALEARPESGHEYRQKVSQLRRRVEQAVAYRDCLWENRVNCEAIRGY